MDSSTLEHLESSSNDNTTAVAEGMEKEKENIDKLLRRNSMGMMPKSLRSLENLNTLPRVKIILLNQTDLVGGTKQLKFKSE